MTAVSVHCCLECVIFQSSVVQMLIDYSATLVAKLIIKLDLT